MSGLAARYRPRRLADVVGQRHVTTVLQRALVADRLPRQLLFSGGSGLGKTTVARVVAAALLCENPKDGDACTECASCRDIFDPSRTHPDVVEFDAASNGLKEQIRELAARAMTAPVRGDWRVYIIDEAHGLSAGGGQAFLKLLEEPPPHVVFMLATTDPDKMLRTNRGRCVEFELARPTDEELAAHLHHVASSEDWTLSDRAAQAVITATDDALGVRGLLMTLEKLAEVLAWSTEPSDDELTTLLGLPPAQLVEAVWQAVEQADKAAALNALAELRMRVSNEAAHRALRDRSRTALRTALAAGTPAELALWRFEQMLSAASTPLWTDLAVAKIARPDLVPTTVVLDALTRDAQQLVRDLHEASRSAAPLAAAPLAAAHAAPGAKPEAEPAAKPAAVPAPKREAETAVKPAPKREAQPAPKASPARATAPAKPAAAPKAAHAKPPAAKADSTTPHAASLVTEEAFLAAVKTHDKKAAAMLRSCKLEFNGSKIRIAGDPRNIESLRAVGDAVRAGASDIGATVSIARTAP